MTYWNVAIYSNLNCLGEKKILQTDQDGNAYYTHISGALVDFGIDILRGKTLKYTDAFNFAGNMACAWKWPWEAQAPKCYFLPGQLRQLRA